MQSNSAFWVAKESQHKEVGWESQGGKEGEKCEDLPSREVPPSASVDRQNKPHDHAGGNNHIRQVARSDDCPFENDAGLLSAERIQCFIQVTKWTICMFSLPTIIMPHHHFRTCQKNGHGFVIINLYYIISTPCIQISSPRKIPVMWHHVNLISKGIHAECLLRTALCKPANLNQIYSSPHNLHNHLLYVYTWAYFLNLATIFLKASSQAYILITLIPLITSFMTWIRLSVRDADLNLWKWITQLGLGYK